MHKKQITHVHSQKRMVGRERERERMCVCEGAACALAAAMLRCIWVCTAHWHTNPEVVRGDL